MPDQVVPGPCPPEGCPPPVEIVCIETTKVYDFCFATQTQDMVCIPIPAACGTPPAGTTVTATVSAVDCTVMSITPIPGSGGFANVMLLVQVMLSITLVRPNGTTLCTFTASFSFMRTVTLCAPTGVTIRCEAPATAVGPAVIVGSEVCMTVTLCLLIESVATVKLLVPSYGFCVPAPCVVSPSPPFVCPPSPLFPPQCTVVPPTTTPMA